jgi:phosphoribosyl-AMP cyclohydrolase
MIDTSALNQLIDAVQFDANGLISAVAQDAHTGEILMLAWMNRAALSETLSSGQAVYYSRSRHTLWRKGESSGQQQRCLSMRLDCEAASHGHPIHRGNGSRSLTY